MREVDYKVLQAAIIILQDKKSSDININRLLQDGGKEENKILTRRAKKLTAAINLIKLLCS